MRRLGRKLRLEFVDLFLLFLESLKEAFDFEFVSGDDGSVFQVLLIEGDVLGVSFCRGFEGFFVMKEVEQCDLSRDTSLLRAHWEVEDRLHNGHKCRIQIGVSVVIFECKKDLVDVVQVDEIDGELLDELLVIRDHFLVEDVDLRLHDVGVFVGLLSGFDFGAEERVHLGSEALQGLQQPERGQELVSKRRVLSNLFRRGDDRVDERHRVGAIHPVLALVEKEQQPREPLVTTTVVVGVERFQDERVASSRVSGDGGDQGEDLSS